MLTTLLNGLRGTLRTRSTTTPLPSPIRPAPRRIIRRTLGGALVLAVLAVIAARVGGRWTSHAGPSGEVATATVAKQAFLRRITADGTLRAVKATEVVVPETPGVWVARKLAWLAPDGSVVKAGDVIVRFDPSDAAKQLREAQADLDSADARLRQEQVRSAATIVDREAAATRARQEADQARQFQAKDPLVFSRNDIIVGRDRREARGGEAGAGRAGCEERCAAWRARASSCPRSRATGPSSRSTTPGPRSRTWRSARPATASSCSAATTTASSPSSARSCLPITPSPTSRCRVRWRPSCSCSRSMARGLEVGQPVDVVVTSRPELAVPRHDPDRRQARQAAPGMGPRTVRQRGRRARPHRPRRDEARPARARDAGAGPPGCARRAAPGRVRARGHAPSSIAAARMASRRSPSSSVRQARAASWSPRALQKAT